MGLRETPCEDHGRTVALKPEGYALVTDPRYKSRCVGLHRLVFSQYYGMPLDAMTGWTVRHTCDNPRCINPHHLELGTKADNNRDRAERGQECETCSESSEDRPY